jgi:mannosyltransferase
MASFQDVTRRLPTAKDGLQKSEEVPRRPEKDAPKTGFFNRRVRLTGDSSFSVPLALVLLFPCLVVIVILTLFARSPDSNELLNMPAGTPPSIRYVLCPNSSCYQPELTLAQENQREIRQALRRRMP